MRMLGCNASKIDAHDKKITKNLTNKIPESNNRSRFYKHVCHPCSCMLFELDY